MSGKQKYISNVLIIMAACLVTVCLITHGKQVRPPTARNLPLPVETIRFKKKDYRIKVPGWGFVEPRETVEIQAEVGGKVALVPAGIHAGAKVKRGSLLFEIDQSEYRIALAEAKAAYEQASQALAVEKGRQAIARAEWKMLKRTKWRNNKYKALALRKPQLKERKAAVQMAAARLDRAALNLVRTRTTAPCDGVILTERLAQGCLLETGSGALKIACTDQFNIVAFFPPECLIDSKERSVEICAGPHKYEGTLKAVLPQVHLKTRHRQALVEFRGAGVALGAYASLALPGTFFKNAVTLPKDALRSPGEVWLIDPDGKLEIRKVEVIAQDRQIAIIGQGISEHDNVVLSHISNPLQGMALRASGSVEQDAPSGMANGGQGG